MSLQVPRFVESNKDLLLARPVSGPLCIVDSSFNPPNSAHLRLARLGLEEIPDSTVVLLLATGNADKPAAPPEQLQIRVEMMELLAREVDPSGKRVTLGLTKAPFFIDKAETLHRAYSDSTLTFVVGFDTLVRFLDQKYYAENVDLVLERFFSRANMLALARAPDAASKTPEIELEAQQAYARSGIRIVPAGPDTLLVSSSRAREATAEELQHLTPPMVARYILEQNLYGARKLENEYKG